MKPAVIGDAAQLPFKSGSFDFVLADPPYSEEEAQSLYGLPYLSMLGLLKECWRVCADGGHVLLLHRLIPISDPRLPDGMRVRVSAIVGVGVLANWSNIRALTVWRKPNRLPLISDKVA